MKFTRKVLLLVAVVVLAVGSSAQAEKVGPGIAAFVTGDASKDIAITNAVPSYSADFTSYANYIGDVYSIAGFYAPDGGDGNADIEYSNEGGLWSGLVHVAYGRNLAGGGSTAWAAYKFVVESGFLTAAGGTIDIDIDFTGVPSTQGAVDFVGASTSLTVDGSLFDFTNSYTDQINMSDLFGGSSAFAAPHSATATIDVPTGVDEFYVVLAKSAPTSGYMISTALDVSANLVVIPEPSSFVLAGFGLLSMLGLARRRK